MNKYINGINTNTYNLLFKKENINIDFRNFSDKDEILYFIERFTLLSNKDIISNTFFNPFIRYKSGFFKKDKFEKNNICINNRGTKYKFLLLDNIIPSINETCNLRSENRNSKCMALSINLALRAKEAGEKVNILTGYVNAYDCRYLHNVIEYIRNDKSYIMDATKNIIMRKELYFDLMNFELINEVDNFTMKEDFDLIGELDLLSKSYFIFRNEIMNDIKKLKILK